MVRISQATSVLLILIGFSGAADAADVKSKERSVIKNSTDETVAFRLGPITVQSQTKKAGNIAGSSNETEFDFRPLTAEKNWVYLVIHHSGTRGGSVEAIHEAHLQRKDSAGNPWLGIGYHFVIGNGNGMPDGSIEPTFRWKQQLHGAHAGSVVHNANGIGICLIGDFEKQKPTGKQLEAVRRLTRQLAKRYDIPPRLLIGHKTIKPTLCPGRHFPLQDVRRNLTSDK